MKTDLFIKIRELNMSYSFDKIDQDNIVYALLDLFHKGTTSTSSITSLKIERDKNAILTFGIINDLLSKIDVKSISDLSTRLTSGSTSSSQEQSDLISVINSSIKRLGMANASLESLLSGDNFDVEEELVSVRSDIEYYEKVIVSSLRSLGKLDFKSVRSEVEAVGMPESRH